LQDLGALPRLHVGFIIEIHVGQSRYPLVSFYFTALHKKYTASIGGAGFIAFQKQGYSIPSP
jgi:hypothetical protein